MELKFSNLQKEIIALQEEVKVSNSLQDEVKVHGSLSTLVAHVTKLKGSLWDAEKQYKVVSDYFEEKALQVEECQNDLEALKSL